MGVITSRRAGFHLLLILLVSIGLYRLAEIRRERIDIVQQDRCVMGTVLTIKVYCRGQGEVRGAIEEAFQVVERLESKMAYRLPGSEVHQVNSFAGEEVHVSQDVMEIISQARKFAELTDGAFDPTIGAITRLWGFDEDRPRLPTDAEIRRDLPLVDFRDILIDSLQGLVALARAGQLLDLGGVAKGYAVDRAAEALATRGVCSGIINAGGDIRVFGTKPDGHPWRIAIRHPRKENRFVGYITLSSGSVATSGDYQRCFFIDGGRYHHLLDPETGWPATGCLSATVTAPTATEADALATASFILGPEGGIELLEKLAHVEGIIIYQDGDEMKVIMTQGMENQIELEKEVAEGRDPSSEKGEVECPGESVSVVSF